MFATRKPDDEWMQRLRTRGFTSDTVFPDANLERLKRKLFNYGGYAVVLAHPEPHFDELMTRSTITSGANLIMEQGEPSSCHANVYSLWLNDADLIMCTGWALSDDGCWRQHSWAKRGNQLVETTEPRVAYFGFDLTLDDSLSF